MSILRIGNSATQPRPSTECTDCDQLLTERDAAQDAADALVNVIERFLGVDCGEHSNLNCPWEKALAVMEGEVERRDAVAKTEPKAPPPKVGVLSELRNGERAP